MQPLTTNITPQSNHFEAFFNHAAMGIIITDQDEKITAINPYALNEFGYGSEELSGKKIEILIPSRFGNHYVYRRKKYAEQPHSLPIRTGIDFIAMKKDGSEFPVQVSLGVYTHKGENFTIAFINNISISKKTALEIKKRNEELETTVQQRARDLNQILKQLEISGSKLDEAIIFQNALLDNAGAIIIAVDNKGIVTLFNRTASLMLGYSPNEIIGKRTPALFQQKSDSDQKIKLLTEKFDLYGKSKFDILTYKAKNNIHDEDEYHCVKKDGSIFLVLLTVTAIRNANGTVTGFAGIATDISERKKAEKELRLALENETGLNELKSRFVSMASHEFRTPLSTVLSSAYLIEKYTSSEDQFKREKHLQRIFSSVNMLTDILNDLLSVGKIEEGKVPVKPTLFNLEEFINGTITEIKINLKSQQTICYQHSGKPDVLLDASLLKMIFMNLVSNAIKFSPENSSIEIKSSVENNTFRLSVKDDGMGISAEDQKHLNERFFRGANAANIEGTGLGLHIVSKYAELMNGTLEFESELDKGTRFLITFKLKEDSNENYSAG